MKWVDHGIVLSVRPFGEGKQIASLLTSSLGRHKGLLSSTRSAKSSANSTLSPGTFVEARWSARLAEQLGRFQLEPYHAPSPLAILFSYPLGLLALQSACGLVDLSLPEQHPYPRIYVALTHLLEALETEEALQDNSWAWTYIDFELTLLQELGFGLDLAQCALHAPDSPECMGTPHYISPKSGRTACYKAGFPYKNKLFSLPQALLQAPQWPLALSPPAPPLQDFALCLEITGYFIACHLLEKHSLPACRHLLTERLSPQSSTKNSIPS